MLIKLSHEEWVSVLLYWDCPPFEWWRAYRKQRDRFQVTIEAEQEGAPYVTRVITKRAFEEALSQVVTAWKSPESVGMLVKDLIGADAPMRDSVLQRAVFGKEVFG